MSSDNVTGANVNAIRKLKVKRSTSTMTHESSDVKDNRSVIVDIGYEDRLPKPPSRPSYTSHMTKRAQTQNLDAVEYGVAMDQSKKENIYRRPSRGKIGSDTQFLQPVYRRRKENVEPTFNFFDNSYKQPILGLVDMVLSKSKAIKDLIENKSISRGYINKYIIEDAHFLLCFTGFLDRMYKAGEIPGDLKNLNKNNFQNLETFIFEKIEKRIRLENIDHAIEEHFKKADNLAKKRIHELTQMLK